MKILYSLIILILSVTACTTMGHKLAPEHFGVDPDFQSYVDEYMMLSRQNHLSFMHKVTIGFKTLNRGDTIGICTYGGLWREIDIDTPYWTHIKASQRLALIFHELTHCYCGRTHDYALDQKYPPTTNERISEALNWRKNGGPRPGHWDDGCPTSLMYPQVVDADCVQAHYSEYIQEMFDRCQPW